MLKTRILTALVLLAACLGVLFLLPSPYAGLAFSVIAALAAWEWAVLLKAGTRGQRFFPLVTLAICLLVGWMPPLHAPIWFLAAAFWLGLIPFWLAFRWPLRGGFVGYLVGLLVIVPAWAAMTSIHKTSPLLLLISMAVVWVADIAAYAVGRIWGKHKLAPNISPGKTWEGAIGAAVAVVLFGALIAYAAPFGEDVLHHLRWAPLPVLLTAVSIIGDLFESLVKRQAGVKDSSTLLPGHGGILDRIDSLTSTLPIVALALVLAKS